MLQYLSLWPSSPSATWRLLSASAGETESRQEEGKWEPAQGEQEDQHDVALQCGHLCGLLAALNVFSVISDWYHEVPMSCHLSLVFVVCHLVAVFCMYKPSLLRLSQQKFSEGPGAVYSLLLVLYTSGKIWKYCHLQHAHRWIQGIIKISSYINTYIKIVYTYC